MSRMWLTQDLRLKKNDTLLEALQKTRRLPFASTDCSLPMTYAAHKGLKVPTVSDPSRCQRLSDYITHV